MALMVDLVRVLSVVNLLLLVGLGYVWVGNWWALRSKHALGLVLFAAFLLGENALAAYYFMFDPTLTAWIDNPQAVPHPAQLAMLSLRALESLGLLFLTWITWD